MPVLTNHVPVTGISGTAGSTAFYTIVVPPGATNLLIMTQQGTGNGCDIGAKLGSDPGFPTDGYSSSRSTSATECIFITNPAAGTWHIGVFGNDTFSGLTLVAAFNNDITWNDRTSNTYWQDDHVHATSLFGFHFVNAATWNGTAWVRGAGDSNIALARVGTWTAGIGATAWRVTSTAWPAGYRVYNTTFSGNGMTNDSNGQPTSDLVETHNVVGSGTPAYLYSFDDGINITITKIEYTTANLFLIASTVPEIPFRVLDGTNDLIKDAPKVVIKRAAVPAVDPVAPIPAYDETITDQVFVQGPIISWVDPFGHVVMGATEPPSPEVGGRPRAGYWTPIHGRGHYESVTRTVHHPGRPGSPGSPAIPAQVEILDTTGWNGGAISIGTIDRDGIYQFVFNQNAAGVVTGFNGQNIGAGYSEIDHAFLCTSGKVSVIESGIIVSGPFLFAADDVFSIVRVNGVVKYFHETTLIYTSTRASEGQVFADASLYVGGDDIIDATISETIDPFYLEYFDAGRGEGAGEIALAGVGSDFDYTFSYGVIIFGIPSDEGGRGSSIGRGRGIGGAPGTGNGAGVGGDFVVRNGSGSGDIDPERPGSGEGEFALGGAIGPIRGGGSDYVYSASQYGRIQLVGTGGSRNAGTASGTIKVHGFGFALDALTPQFAIGTGIIELEGEAQSLIAPQYAIAHGVIHPFTTWGFGEVSNYGIGSGEITVRGIGADFFYTEARGEIGPFDGYGVVFAGGSLIVANLWTQPITFIGIGSVGPDPVGLRGVLPVPTLTAFGGGAMRAALPVPTLHATGTVSLVGRLNATLPLPTISASGTAQVVGRLAATLPHPYALTGYGGGYTNMRLPVPTLSASGTAQVLGRLNAALPGSPSLIGVGGASAVMRLPVPTLSATGTAPVIGRLNGKLPKKYALTAYGGGSCKARLPVPTLVASGSVPDIGRLNAVLPSRITMVGYGGGAMSGRLPFPTLVATGTAAVIGRLSAKLPGKYALTAYSGGSAKITLPLPTISASGTVSLVGRLDAALPGMPTLAATGVVDLLGRLDALLPALRMVPVGVMRARVPFVTLVATGTVGAALTQYEAYSVTLFQQEDGNTGVAVTRITDHPFDQIVRWRDRYYGIAKDGVYELTGDTFNGKPIVSSIETFETDFGQQQLKKWPSLYFSGRIGADFQFTQIADEKARHSYSANGPSQQDGSYARRVKMGKGTKATYYALGMSNPKGEDYVIDALSPEIEQLRRTAS